MEEFGASRDLLRCIVVSEKQWNRIVRPCKVFRTETVFRVYDTPCWWTYKEDDGLAYVLMAIPAEKKPGKIVNGDYRIISRCLGFARGRGTLRLAKKTVLWWLEQYGGIAPTE